MRNFGTYSINANGSNKCLRLGIILTLVWAFTMYLHSYVMYVGGKGTREIVNIKI